MKNLMYTCVYGLVGTFLAGPSFAQNTSKLTVNIGGGFTEPAGRSNSRLDRGYNLGAGVGMNIVSALGVRAEFGYNQLGLQSSLLSRFGAPNGEARIYSATLNPVIHLNPTGRFDTYFIGGGGYYRRTVEFTQPTVQTVIAFDPFFGYFPVGVPANQILASYTQNKAGWNSGLGVSFRLKGDSNARFYTESRYHYIYTTPVRTTVFPVTFGFRW